jgi:hypothetical protein
MPSLHEYQRRAAQHIVDSPAAFLALEVGRRLASADFFRHYSPVTEKNVTGIGVLFGAAMSRNDLVERLFCRLGLPSFGRPGGRAARPPVLHRYANSRSVAHPIGVGLAVTYRNWSKHMNHVRLSVDDLDKAQLRICCAQSNLTALGIELSGGASASGETLDSALHAVAELLETVNDILSKAEVNRV